ncbi:MAG TPA: hypothetical protein VGJ70_16400, partial [Solirubrobacteraceae bacterium]
MFLSPTGSDVKACTQAAPCRGLQRGFNVAAPGQVVELAAGTYQTQDLTGDKGNANDVVFRPAAGATVSFSGRLTLEDAKHVTLTDFNLSRNDPYRDLELASCNVDVTFVNATGKRFQIFEGNRDITFQGGDWGGYGATDEEDSGIGTRGSTGPTTTCAGESSPQPARNIVFDGVTWHDVFWGVPQSAWGGSHPDCFEINGFVDGLTIRNSSFLRCGDSFFAVYPDQGDTVNILVESNLFQDLGDYAWYGTQISGEGKPHKCGNITFRNNTWRPNNPSSLEPYSPLRTDCEALPGTLATKVTGNSFQRGPESWDCSAFRA